MLRRARFELPLQEQWALLQRVGELHVGGADASGEPIVRVLHHAIADDALWFHGAPGEKNRLVGRRVAISAHELVARIPSYARDPQRACPATTYFRSVAGRGRFERVEEASAKAMGMQALMERLQPEGGYQPIHHDDSLYHSALKGLPVYRIRLDHMVGKAKLGQHLAGPEIERIVLALWKRGGEGDLAAIRTILEAHPAKPWPDVFRGPGPVRLIVHCTLRERAQAGRLLEGQYWTQGQELASLEKVHELSPAWVGALNPEGDLVGMARAQSDRYRRAYVMDTVVTPAVRGRGVGTALMKLLLNHPWVREVASVGLATKNAGPFYRRLGFRSDDGFSLYRRSQ
ncbi:MAG: GNAT family N-acetyltransferase [Myxococcales bacterium FL481]|nr:MAG: GNAT family N-acetyltransferase [Myxococcales bacterium FL481]